VEAAPPEIAIAWQVGSSFGGGVYGYRIAVELERQGLARPMLMSRPAEVDPPPAEQALFATVRARNRAAIRRIHAAYEGRGVRLAVPVLQVLGNDAAPQFMHPRIDYRGPWTAGLAFLEDTRISPEGHAALARFERLVAGSSWNAALLRSRGFDHCTVSQQGVDTDAFAPGPRSRRWADRFVILSIGKLEFRKGQDVVLKAVAAFAKRHPETLLVTLWSNQWLRGPSFGAFRSSPHFPALPDHAPGGQLDWAGLFAMAGLTEANVVGFGGMSHRKLPALMRHADVALFAGRCEAGTNLPAMEAMAAGLPVILPAHTGHLDIIEDGACLPLRRLSPVRIEGDGPGTEGWGEPDVDEVVEALERVHADRAAAARVGAAGAAAMRRFAWAHRIRALAGEIGLG
jgi:glycosyltransferase involved in cell wall biosynthesis